MTPSNKCIDLIKQFEGLSLKSYICPAGVNTIGYGNTRWQDGRKVELGEQTTMTGATKLLQFYVNKFADSLPDMKVNQNQFDAIVSFVYNVGMANFKFSTLFKLIKANPNDPNIREEFMKWTKARDSKTGTLKTLKGLVKRREAEANLYFA
jgi:lysozyme